MKKILLVIIMIIIFVCIIITFISPKNVIKPSEETEIVKSSNEFKADPNLRAESAKKLIPLLKIGMSFEDVESLLGAPNQKKVSDDSEFWFYVLGYSQYLDIQFDSERRIQEIEACAPGLSDTGYYKLEK